MPNGLMKIWRRFVASLQGVPAISQHRRRRLLRWMGVDISYSACVFSGCTFAGSKVRIADDVFINVECIFDASEWITIGHTVRIGHRVTILTSTHEIGPASCRAGKDTHRPVTIGAGTWVGASSTILPGVTIGTGCVIAAGAVVTKNVPDNSLVAGVPARLVKMLEM